MTISSSAVSSLSRLSKERTKTWSEPRSRSEALNAVEGLSRALGTRCSSPWDSGQAAVFVALVFVLFLCNLKMKDWQVLSLLNLPLPLSL